MPSPAVRLFVSVFVFSWIVSGCGSGSSPSAPPANPVFTSVPVTTADEATLYSYQLAATSPDGSTVSFSLAQSPEGASVSGSTISWTPTHAQSRNANQFSVTATSASGGSATQSWSVAPSGIVVITAVFTYWTSSGSTNRPSVFPVGLPFPAALIPRSDGSFARLLGASNPDGTFSIPHVPAGYYWLGFSPNTSFWTSSSNFDAGQDFVDTEPSAATQSTTTIAVTLTGADPIQQGDLFTTSSDVFGVPLPFAAGVAVGATTISFALPINSNLDFSQVHNLFFSQYEPVTSGGFSGAALGSSLTQSNVTLTNGAVNSVGGALSTSPKNSIPLSIKGTEWVSNFQNTAPNPPTLVLTDYSVGVQPFVQGRIANSHFAGLNPSFTLLAPIPVSSTLVSFAAPIGSFCTGSSGPTSIRLPDFGIPPITTDQDFGSLSYGDPYPSSWIREFQICQEAAVEIPRPNSTVTDTFLVTADQTTALPIAPVVPLIGPVQSPTINGSSLFQSSALNTTALNFAWTPPSGTTPNGYYLTVFSLGALPTGAVQYIFVGRFGTAKNTLTLPPVIAGNTYVFVITAQINAGANIETSPYRSQLPIAHTSVVSAPVTINPGATANIGHSLY
jgi:hypothetical protein